MKLYRTLILANKPYEGALRQAEFTFVAANDIDAEFFANVCCQLFESARVDYVHELAATEIG